MKVKSEIEVAQSCLTLWDPMDCSLPVSFIHGVLQARVLEWGAKIISGKGKLSPQEICVTKEKHEEVPHSGNTDLWNGLKMINSL